jgi:hypothetical protein
MEDGVCLIIYLQNADGAAQHPQQLELSNAQRIELKGLSHSLVYDL